MRGELHTHLNDQAHLNDHINDNVIRAAGPELSVEDFTADDIWVVDEGTFRDLGLQRRHVLEPDYFRSNTPYHDCERARALMGLKLVVCRDTGKGFILEVGDKVRTATAEGFFKSCNIISGGMLFGRYESVQILKKRFEGRLHKDGVEKGVLEPTFALYISSPVPFSAARITPEMAGAALAKRREAALGPAPVLGL
jgi:hypothetical protein